MRKNAVLVGTGSQPVRLGDVKAFGKKQMAAADWARGVRVESGARFSCLRRLMGQVDAAREAAYDVLAAVREQDAYTNLVLPQLLRTRGIRDRDAAFTTELVSGTIRRQGTYDAVLATLVNRPLGQVDPAVLDALRLGVHQLLGMRVPSHAAVGTTVDLVRAKVGHRPAGFVNAVLRKVAERDLDAWVRRVAPDPGTDPVGYAVVAHSHPRWVVEELAAALGPAAGELDALLPPTTRAPKVTLVARPGLVVGRGARRGRGSGVDDVALRRHARRRRPGLGPGRRRGRAGVQDEGSQLVALALAAADGRRPGRAVARPVRRPRRQGRPARRARRHAGRPTARGGAPAAPGGAGAFRHGGRRSTGCSAWSPRTAAAPPGGRGRSTGCSWTRRAGPRRAPAPARGALAPDRRRRVGPRAAPARRCSGRPSTRCGPGGVVAYVTCSPVLAETSGVVSDVLAARDDVRLEDAAPLFAGVPDLRAEQMTLPGTVQLWPHRQGTDAMFLALLRKA